MPANRLVAGMARSYNSPVEECMLRGNRGQSTISRSNPQAALSMKST
jgi:hypothetical protein